LYSQVEGCLTTKSKEDPIWLFSFDDIGDILGCDWKVVDLAGKLVVGLDGSNVGVDKD
jgi:hypothetical protein